VALSICGLGLLDETEVETIPNGPSSANGSTPRRLGPGAIFNAWDAQGHPSRKELYDYVSTTFKKRVTALTPEELAHVREWIESQAAPSAAPEVAPDAA